MRRPAAILTALTLAAVLCFAAGREGDTCALTLRLIDARSGRELPGLVHFEAEDGSTIRPAELLSRGLGLTDGATADQSIHQERARVLDVYADGIAALQRHIQERARE